MKAHAVVSNAAVALLGVAVLLSGRLAAQTNGSPERFTIRFSQRTPLPDHGEQVVLVTDRYIDFWEATNRPRTVDYPFTVIELHIDGDGKGEGNYATQPVMLNDVRREKA